MTGKNKKHKKTPASPTQAGGSTPPEGGNTPAAGGGTPPPEANNPTHESGTTYKDPVAAANYNANVAALNAEVKRRRRLRNAITLWLEDMADALKRLIGHRFSLDTIRGWLNGKETGGQPNHTIMPSIAAIYNEELKVNPPLLLEDFYKPNIMQKVNPRTNTLLSLNGLRVTIEDFDRFGTKERQFFDQVIKPLLRGKSPADDQHPDGPVTSEQFRNFMEKKVIGFDFPPHNFGRPCGQTCAATAEIEGNLNGVLKRFGIEARVAPVIGDIQEPFGELTHDDLQRFKIMLLGRWGYDFIIHALRELKNNGEKTTLALAGGVHVNDVVSNMKPEEVVHIDAVAPIAVTQTEKILTGFAPFDLRPDIMDPPGLRANDLVQVLGDLAARIGYTGLLMRKPTWYDPDDISRDRLYPKAKRVKYFEELRGRVAKQCAANPALVKVTIQKLDALERYFDTVDGASIALMGVGHLSENDGEFKAVVKGGVVGNLLFRFLSPTGRQVKQLDDLNQLVMGLPLEWLKERCASGYLNAVLLATGAVKLQPLLAVVRGRACRTILIDAHLASLLYEELRREDEEAA